MSTSRLDILPARFREQYDAHPWHGEIADFRLPAKTVQVINNARVTRSDFLGPEFARGGVYDERGLLVQSSRHLRRSKDFTRDLDPSLAPGGAATSLPGRHIYLGWYFNHYGHFLLESLARCWYLLERERPAGAKYLFHLHADNGIAAPRHLEFLELLDINAADIQFVTEDLVLEELIVPAQQAVLSRAVSDSVLQVYRRIRQQALQEAVHPPVEKIYVSRRLLAGDQRRALNEQTLEATFERCGYKVVHPQLLSVREQVAIFAQARYFAGLDGSGLHNILFARDPQTMRLYGALNRIPDSMTQVQLNDLVGCETRLVLQAFPRVRHLKPEVMPFILSKGDMVSLLPCTSGAIPGKESAYVVYSWLKALATRLIRLGVAGDAPALAGDLELDEDLAGLLVQLVRLNLGESIELLATDGDGAASLENQLLAGDYYAFQGKLDLARKCFQACLDAGLEDVDFLLGYGRLLIKKGCLQDALQPLGQAQEQDPLNPEIAFVMAGGLLESGEHAIAGQQIARAIRLAPAVAAYRQRHARILANQGRYGEAADALLEVLDLAPQRTDLYPQLTWWLMQDGRSREAEGFARMAIKVSSGNPVPYVHLSRILAGSQRNREAIEAITGAIELDADKAFYRQHRGMLYLRAGEVERAIADLQHAVKLSPENAEARRLLAVTLEQKNR